MKPLTIIACAVVVSGLMGPGASTASPAAVQPATEPVPAGRSPELWALLDEYVGWLLRENPTWASQRGDRRFDERLPEVDPEAVTRRLQARREFLSELEGLDRARFSEADRTTADLLARELRLAIAGSRFHPEQKPVTALAGPQVWLAQLPDRLRFRDRKDRAAFLARLERIPGYLDDQIEQMRRGMEAGRVPPRVAVRGADQQALSLATDAIKEDPTRSPFYRPFRALDPDDALARRAQRVISESVTPAFERFGQFLRSHYLPACRESVGASEGVDGVDAYNHALRVQTTTALTADEIHRIGLEEVARIRREMMGVIRRTDWYEQEIGARDAEPDEDALFDRFVRYLRSADRFYYDEPEALLRGYRDIAKRVDAELPAFFRLLPRLTYGVREMSPRTAPNAPTAYYYRGSIETGVPGYFVANTYALDQRPRYEMIALTLHEAVPGHHLQIALAQELEGVHEYRTLTSENAFSEGWALYSERLGLEMGEDPIQRGGRGLYADPYDDFGRLTYEMWRACRLVVDTGLHAKGWARDRAIDYMLANTALSELNVEREVDRYIGWPGQACGYKLGELRIRELRRRAQDALGERFDLREFHEVVLGAGSIPLGVLENRVERWIRSVRASSARSPG